MRTRRPPMTPLRQRMGEDMQLRNFSAQTMRASLHGVAAFAQHFHTSPEHLGPAHVRTSQLFLVRIFPPFLSRLLRITLSNH